MARGRAGHRDGCGPASRLPTLATKNFTHTVGQVSVNNAATASTSAVRSSSKLAGHASRSSAMWSPTGKRRQATTPHHPLSSASITAWTMGGHQAGTRNIKIIRQFRYIGVSVGYGRLLGYPFRPMPARSEDVDFWHFSEGWRAGNPRLLFSPYMLIPPLLSGVNFRARRVKSCLIKWLPRAIILIMGIYSIVQINKVCSCDKFHKQIHMHINVCFAISSFILQLMICLILWYFLETCSTLPG